MDSYTPEVDGGNKHVEARGHSAAPLLLSSLPKSQLHDACSSSARGPPYLKFPCRFCKNTISRTRGSGLCSLHSASALSRSYAWDRRRKDSNPAGCGQHRNRGNGGGPRASTEGRERKANNGGKGRQAKPAGALTQTRGQAHLTTPFTGTQAHKHTSTQAHKHTRDKTDPGQGTPGTRQTRDKAHT
jgi:hypothetical protein